MFVFFVLETAAGFYEKLVERLGFGLGSALLITLFLLMGSMRKWLQNKGIMCSRKAELTGLHARHTGMQQRLCQLQETHHSKITMLVLLAAAESDGSEQSFFAEFDGIIDAQMATGMDNKGVRQLILSANDAAAVNGPAATASPSPSLGSAVVTAEVHPLLRRMRNQTSILTYDENWKQMEQQSFRGDSE